LVFNFGLLWCVCQDPAFSPLAFLGLSLGKGLIILGDTFINPADVPSSWLSLELEDALAGSVT